MNGSLVFARWRQRAPHLMHASLGPARAQIPNGIWISSATFAQLMAVYNRPPLSPLKIARANRGIWTPSNTWVSWTQLSLQPKWHIDIDWFNRFCTAHGRLSIYFTMRDLEPHLIHEPTTQAASRSVQPFLQGSLAWPTDQQITLLGLQQ